MASKILSDIISGAIELERFYEWISGKEIEGISPDLNRAEFALHVLNYIQEETNKFFPSESGTKPLPDENQTSIAEDGTLKNSQSKEEQTKQITETYQRTPFQLINKASPTKTKSPKAFSPSKTVRHLLEPCPNTQKMQPMLRPKTMSCNVTESSREKGMRLITSTPQHQVRYEPGFHSSDSSGSLHSDTSSLCYTPHSRGKNNMSGGSHRGSPVSNNSSSFSPLSPNYSDAFPDLGGSRGRHRASYTPCLGNFIVAKPASQKNRKRIKPTQLTAVLDKDAETGLKQESGKFGSTSRPFVPIDTPQPELKKKSNYEEERNLLKQKRTESLIITSRTSLQNSPSSQVHSDESIALEEIILPKQTDSVHSNSSIDAPSLPTNPEILVVNPDPTLVTCLDKIERLANVYSACFDKNLIPNITTELYFIFTIITSDYKIKRSCRDITNTPKDDRSQLIDPRENVKRKILFTDNPTFPIVYEVNKDIFTNQQQNPLLQNEEVVIDCCDGSTHNNFKDVVIENGHYNDDNSNLSSMTSSDVESETDKKLNKNKCVLNSVHNCVMFAAIVLQKQITLIQFLTKGVIRLLWENSRVTSFVPNVIPRLSKIIEEQEAKRMSARNLSPQKPIISTNGPIIFQSETDSKENFSSSIGFNSFKKQRDTFYEIFYEWNSKNTDNDWVTKRFPQRTQALLGMSSDPVNMMHLARLFCTQLTNFKEDSEKDSELELPGLTKDKLSRLKARFSKPNKHTLGPRPPPQFPAKQQFYQQFLKSAKGTTFPTHVADWLIYRINQLNKTSFFIDGISPEVSQALVKACVSDCCLLAKFLGLLVFSPYTSEEVYSPHPDLLSTQILVRQQSVPPVDLYTYLQQALASNRLVVTVPWIVAFLGMMDPVSPFLPCYQSPLQLLAKIYLSFPLPHLSPIASFLLRSSLGWLFDPSFFPVQVFCYLTTATIQLSLSSSKEVDADTQNVVDYGLVFELCPGLASLQMILSSSKTKGVAARHITPVPALTTPATPITAAQTLELQLEESFLNGQAPSFRATVEFVVDRLSSSCIKYICSDVIAPTKEQALEAINKGKKLSKEEQQTWIESWCSRTGEQMEAALAEYCGPRLVSVLPSLLGPEAFVGLPTAQAICSRRCRERIINWLNSHFNFPEMFTKLIPAPDAKPVEEQLAMPLEERKVKEHRDSVMSPPNMLIKLQDLLCQCIETGNILSNEENVLDLLTAVSETLTYRQDLTEPSKNMIYKMTIDLSIVIMARKPRVMTNKVLQELCKMWKSCSSTGDKFGSLVSPRNALLLCQGGSTIAPQTWIQLSQLLVNLLQTGLVTPKQLEGQWVALLKLEWPRNVLTLFESCLNSMLEKIKKDPVCSDDPKFILVLEWIGEISGELAGEEFPDD